MYLTPKKKSKLLSNESEFDFMQILSVERFMDLIKGFETLKNFLFDEKNKFNFDRISSMNMISNTFNLDDIVENKISKENKENLQTSENDEIMRKIVDMMDIHN